MSKYRLVFLLILVARGLLADDFKTIDGKEYKNVTVSRVEPDGIVLTSSSGISKVYFTELPKEVQERFHYDAAKGAAYSSEQAATQEALGKQQEELRRKLADQNNKYWIERESAKNQHVDRVRQIQQHPARQEKATADYAAKEKARMVNLDQRKTLSSDIQHLHSERQLIEKSNRSTADVTREVEAKSALLKPLGGQF
jgi:hypothetical protein